MITTMQWNNYSPAVTCSSKVHANVVEILWKIGSVFLAFMLRVMQHSSEPVSLYCTAWAYMSAKYQMVLMVLGKCIGSKEQKKAKAAWSRLKSK